MRINNSSNKFDTGHDPIKVKVTESLCLFQLKHKRLSDFINCSERFNIQSEGPKLSFGIL